MRRAWRVGDVRLLIVLTVASLLTSCQSARQERPRAAGSAGANRYIDALVSAPDLRTVYASDGAADATVMENPIPEVRSILSLGPEAVPLLIEHLDDERPTGASFDGVDGRKRVAAGHVCLDILTHAVDAPQIFVKDCADDGPGACVGEGFYFRPYGEDASVIRGVKANWQRVHREGKVKFKYPAWLR